MWIEYTNILDVVVLTACWVGYDRGAFSDNGSSYISGELADWLAGQSMEHVRGAPCRPQTQGEIGRWHQALKNRILLENCYLPGALEQAIKARTIEKRHLLHRQDAAETETPMSQTLRSRSGPRAPNHMTTDSLRIAPDTNGKRLAG